MPKLKTLLAFLVLTVLLLASNAQAQDSSLQSVNSLQGISFQGSTLGEEVVIEPLSFTTPASYPALNLSRPGGGACNFTVSIGCFCHASGQFLCVVTVSGGSGPYHYGWSHSGSGNLFPNGSQASLEECVDGTQESFGVLVTDTATGAVCSANTQHTCVNDAGGGFGGPF